MKKNVAIRNAHQAFLAATAGPCSEAYQEIISLRHEAGLAVTPEAIANDLWRIGGWRLARTTPPSKAVDGTDALRVEYGLTPGTPQTRPQDVVSGRWKGHFLMARDFFSPALASLSPARRKEIFKAHRADGLETILINAEQDDWGPRRGHPEWTHGGFSAYAFDGAMGMLVDVLKEARQAGLNIWLGVLDQPSLSLPMDEIIARTRALIDATWAFTTGYMLSWEIREVWTNSELRELNENRWIESCDWHDRHVGLHYQSASRELTEHDDGLGGGISRYQDLERIYGPHKVTRMLQYHHAASDGVLQEQTRRTAGVVHVDHGVGAFCCFEHSSERNQPTIYTTAGVERRRKIIMDEVARLGLEPERTGFMN